jgi:serine/threonine-protein kinase
VNTERLARGSGPYLLSGIGGLALAWLIVALFIFPGGAVASSDVLVPNVTGMSYADAAVRLKAAGLSADKGEQRYSSTIPSGGVLDQTPDPGSSVAKGASVLLDLSRGEQQVAVPRVTGLSRDQAQRLLEDAGLDVGEVTNATSDAPYGQVLASTPPSGTQVSVPSPVNLSVSAGPPDVTVPDVVGQDYAQARVLLGQLGFVIGKVTTDTASALPPNTVVSQSPAASSVAHAGATITLSISGHP